MEIEGNGRESAHRICVLFLPVTLSTRSPEKAATKPPQPAVFGGVLGRVHLYFNLLESTSRHKDGNKDKIPCVVWSICWGVELPLGTCVIIPCPLISSFQDRPLESLCPMGCKIKMIKKRGAYSHTGRWEVQRAAHPQTT